MPITTVIIEDEKPAARRLQRLLADFSTLDVVQTLHSVEEATTWLASHPSPQLIFADIVLGDGLSFDIFEQIDLESFIIYTTAFDQYTLKAFKLNSIDYLLKPIDKEELAYAINKFKSYLPEEKNFRLGDLKTLMQDKKEKLHRLVVKVGSNLKIVLIGEVSCFYTENKMVYAQTAERSFPVDFSLEALEHTLAPESFFRISRQCIVSLHHITNVHTSPFYKVSLDFQPQKEAFTISRERVKEFKRWLSG